MERLYWATVLNMQQKHTKPLRDQMSVRKIIRNVAIGVLLAMAVERIFDLGPKRLFSLPLTHKAGEMADPQQVIYRGLVRLSLKGGNGFCSGWVIDKNYAITAAHCINTNGYIDREAIKLFSETGVDTGVLAEATAYDVDLDMGLIRGDFHVFQPVATEFYKDGFPRELGHSYYSLGFPLGQKMLASSSFVPEGMEYFMVKGQGHLIQGMSGGPVVNERGVVVGINSAVDSSHSIVAPIQGFLGRFGLE
jgi:Trypsin-like peptidase domain